MAYDVTMIFLSRKFWVQFPTHFPQIDFVPVGRIEKLTQPYVLTTLMRPLPTPALTGESSIYFWTSPEDPTYPTALT